MTQWAEGIARIKQQLAAPHLRTRRGFMRLFLVLILGPIALFLLVQLLIALADLLWFALLLGWGAVILRAFWIRLDACGHPGWWALSPLLGAALGAAGLFAFLAGNFTLHTTSSEAALLAELSAIALAALTPVLPFVWVSFLCMRRETRP